MELEKHLKYDMKIAVFCNIKDEQRYLEQWIKHCLKIGINKIVLYEDKGSVSHKDICDKYPEVDLITGVLDVKKSGHKDTDCWQDFIFRYDETEVDWVAKIDPDEYINTNKLSLEDILTIDNCNHQVYIQWRIHNANGRITAPAGIYDICKTYKRWIASKDIDYSFSSNVSDNKWDLGKSFVRYSYARKQANLFGGFPHLYFWVNKVTTSMINTKYCWIDHYVCKSFEEYLWRLTVKGISNPQSARKLGDFFIINPDMQKKIPQIEKKFGIKLQ